jgi:hypothetical protein
MRPVAPAALRNSRFFIPSPLGKKKASGRSSLPNAFVHDRRAVAPFFRQLRKGYASDVPLISNEFPKSRCTVTVHGIVSCT